MLLARGATGAVLDIGFAEKPNPFFAPSAHVTGVDLVPSDPIPGYQRQIVGDFTDCSELEGVEFDYVVAGEVIEHLEQPYDFLKAARERLGVGGVIKLSTPNPLGFPVLIYELMRSKGRFYAADHLFYFNPRWVVKMMRSVGFTDIQVRPVGLWLPGVPIPWSPVSMSYQVIYAGRRAS
ncbi:MAG TPA: methyltransferase domain-containing protein [Acidimicrobiia bacterium]|jgi:2-polyprenyl-3-methyl-5-hydroxy-6-metoxy-1,4-benzoquinol methylase